MYPERFPERAPGCSKAPPRMPHLGIGSSLKELLPGAETQQIQIRQLELVFKVRAGNEIDRMSAAYKLSRDLDERVDVTSTAYPANNDMHIQPDSVHFNAGFVRSGAPSPVRVRVCLTILTPGEVDTSMSRSS